MRIAHPVMVGMLALAALTVPRGAQGAGTVGLAGDHAPISLQELQERGVVGPLGRRLGTIVEITGVAVANTSRAKAEADLPFRLRVDTLDGRPLKESVIYPFVRAGAELTLAAPAVGDSFHYVGYESGGFGGSPEGEFHHVAPRTTTGYAFETWFVVLMVK